MLRKLVQSYVDRTEPDRSEADVKAEVERRHTEIGKSVAMRFTRGNVSIQDGAFLMKDELEATIKRKTNR